VLTGEMNGADETYRIYGYTPGEACPNEAWVMARVHPEDKGMMAAFMDSVRSEGSRKSVDYRIVRPDGGARHVTAVADRAVRDVSGNVRWVYGITQDITERKQAEEEARQLACIVTSSDDAIISKTLDGTITSWNEGAERLYGYTAAEALGMPIEAIMPPDCKQELADILCRIRRGERVEHHDTVRLTKDGRRVDVSITVSPIIDVAGRMLGVSTIARDISGRKQAEAELLDKQEELEIQAEELEVQAEELRANNEDLEDQVQERRRAEESLRETSDYLESLINYANAPIIVCGPDFKVTRFNHAFERLTGYTAAEIVGEKPDKLFSQESKEESISKIRRAIAGKHWESVEIPILTKGGETRTVLWNSANVYDKHGRMPAATIAQGQDITGRKRAEEAMKDAKMQAELYLDLMGHDISNMHQIALSQLELAQEILAEKGKLGEIDRELIDTPIETLYRSAVLIDNVRKLQKLRAGEYKPEEIDLGMLLADVVSDVVREHTGLPGDNVIININFTPVDGCLVKANPLLKDVFANLLGNAVKHSGGSVTINLWVDRAFDGIEYYRVVVEDNGPGIPDEKKAEVFYRFKRGQTMARGTGLGLYIVKTLVDSFYGRVKVEDRVPGDYTKGARFIVYLPALKGGSHGE
jgi:PAS domain S-box-containing protein